MRWRSDPVGTWTTSNVSTSSFGVRTRHLPAISFTWPAVRRSLRVAGQGAASLDLACVSGESSAPQRKMRLPSRARAHSCALPAGKKASPDIYHAVGPRLQHGAKLGPDGQVGVVDSNAVFCGRRGGERRGREAHVPVKSATKRPPHLCPLSGRCAPAARSAAPFPSLTPITTTRASNAGPQAGRETRGPFEGVGNRPPDDATHGRAPNADRTRLRERPGRRRTACGASTAPLPRSGLPAAARPSRSQFGASDGRKVSRSRAHLPVGRRA